MTLDTNQQILQPIYDLLGPILVDQCFHGFGDVTINFETVAHEKRKVTIRAGKSHLLYLPPPE